MCINIGLESGADLGGEIGHLREDLSVGKRVFSTSTKKQTESESFILSIILFCVSKMTLK